MTFLEYSKTKPTDERYHYVDPSNCAYAQYLQDTGRQSNSIVRRRTCYDDHGE